MKILFMGTPAFAVPSLCNLAESSHDVVAVITNPDRPKGRGRKTYPPPVKQAALQLDLPCLQPQSLKDSELHGVLSDFKCDLFVVVAFSVLPSKLLTIPQMGAINLHPSLLPAYRGAAPIVWALFNGEHETGATTFLLNPRVDAGDILLQEHVAIGPEETAEELEDSLAKIGGALVVKTVAALLRKDIQPYPQKAEGVSKAPKLSKEDGRLQWSRTSEVIRNNIRGANPVPGAFSTWRKDEIIKIHRARIYGGDSSGNAGTVLASDNDRGLVIATGNGALILDEVQPAGRKCMSGKSFLRGYNVKVGDQFGA